MRVTRWIAVTGLVTATGGCGMGLFESESGGADNLPTEAAGPYGKLDIDSDTPADEPYVLVDRQASLLDPTVLSRDDDGVRLWFGRELDNDPEHSEIWRAEIPSIHDLPDVEPVVTLVADQPWEETRVAAPSVYAVDRDTVVMYYEGGLDPVAIGRAESHDGGATWIKDPDNPVLTGAEPSAAPLDGGVVLYYTRTDQPGIFRADSADGHAFTEDPDPVLVARDDPEAFDLHGVSDPCIVVEISEAGQLHFGLFYNGTNQGDDVAIGYAGSFDGREFERFSGLDPVLQPASPDENGPAAILGRASGTLFFHEVRLGRQRIAVAVHP